MLNHSAEAHIRSTNISTQELYKSWIEISRVALIENIFSYKKIVSPAMLACVIKSNAYGHGMNLVAQLCDQLDIVDWLCVVSLSEAVALRKQAIKKPLLVLSILDQDLIDAVVHDIDVVVCEYTTALALNACASMVGKKARVHIKVDTGLSRIGVMLDEAVSFVQKLRELPHLAIVGIFTHFATAEAIDQTYTNQQINHFTKILTQLRSAGVDIELRHSSCSAAITSNQRSHFTMARAGIGLFGLWSSPESQQLALERYPSFELKPVLSWKTTIMHVKALHAGAYVGYDCTYQAPRAMRVAILPIGYWDGYDRQLSNRGHVLVKGLLAPVIGRISMNLTIIDITDIPAQVSDQVTLLGNAAGIRAEDLARHCNTINYEIVTRINPLLPRIITQ